MTGEKYTSMKEDHPIAIVLRPVTDENRAQVLALAVAPDQRRHIETTAECLAEAAQDARWRPMGLYHEDDLIGFAMVGAFPGWTGPDSRVQVWLDRLLVDARHQGRGYGEAALRVLLAALETMYGTDRVFLSVYGDNERAIALYEKHGFCFNGELDTKGERVMVREGSTCR